VLRAGGLTAGAAAVALCLGFGGPVVRTGPPSFARGPAAVVRFAALSFACDPADAGGSGRLFAGVLGVERLLIATP
jgi:hypothetical protein